MLAHVVVEAAQDVLAAIDQRHLGAEPVEDAGELDRDIAAALDENALRQLLQMERLVRGDDVLEARDLGARDGAPPPVAIRIFLARSFSPLATRRTVCASSSTARLLTIATFARSRVVV